MKKWMRYFLGRSEFSGEEERIVDDSKINVLDWRRQLVLFPLALLMRVWNRTLRMELLPEDERLLRETESPVILLFWHNRLFVVAETHRRFRRHCPTYGLVSASRDGAWLAAFLRLMGLHAVRGSSSNRGREAVGELSARLAEGKDVAITPDGPRGPIYSFKPGAAILARRSRATVLLVHFECGSAWRLRSWDRFLIPKPFSRVKIRCRKIAREELPADLGECTAVLGEALREMGE